MGHRHMPRIHVQLNPIERFENFLLLDSGTVLATFNWMHVALVHLSHALHAQAEGSRRR